MHRDSLKLTRPAQSSYTSLKDPLYYPFFDSTIDSAVRMTVTGLLVSFIGCPRAMPLMEGFN